MGIIYKIAPIAMISLLSVGLVMLFMGNYRTNQELKNTIQAKEIREKVQNEVNISTDESVRDRLLEWVQSTK